MIPIPLTKPMTPELARAVYACLVVGMNADPRNADMFTKEFSACEKLSWRDFSTNDPTSGYRFIVSNGTCVVDCLWDEDRTPIKVAAIERTMRGLAVLMEGK